MEAKKRIENDPAIGEVLFHDDDCLIKVNNKKLQSMASRLFLSNLLWRAVQAGFLKCPT